jgi:lipopolysaccharide biosynthesis glycosyltransferase
MKLALVTVSSDGFLDGTLVLFQSFINNNKWFNGDFVVIDGGLSAISQQKLMSKFNAIIHKPGDLINRKLDQLIEQLPAYKKSRSRFYSVEFLSLKNYNCLLFADSDILCSGSAKILFNESGFAACADPKYYSGFVRSKLTLKPINRTDKTELFKGDFIDRLFNTGLMVAGSTILSTSIYKDLIDMIAIKNFKDITNGHTDTVVFNKLLLDKVVWLHLKFNFYSSFTDTDISKDVDPVFVHFIRNSKPWLQHTQNKWSAEWYNVKRQLYEK